MELERPFPPAKALRGENMWPRSPGLAEVGLRASEAVYPSPVQPGKPARVSWDPASRDVCIWGGSRESPDVQPGAQGGKVALPHLPHAPAQTLWLEPRNGTLVGPLLTQPPSGFQVPGKNLKTMSSLTPLQPSVSPKHLIPPLQPHRPPSPSLPLQGLSLGLEHCLSQPLLV